jgi:hypothetical protein
MLQGGEAAVIEPPRKLLGRAGAGQNLDRGLDCAAADGADFPALVHELQRHPAGLPDGR